jgi:VWFA-related protein
MRTPISTIFFCLLIVVWTVFVGRSQAPQNPAPQNQSRSNAATTAQGNAPVIRTTTRLVQVSVVVTDKKGQVVTGLKKEHFTIVDGKDAQQIAVFSGPEALAPSQPVRTLPANIFTNRRDKLGEKPGSNTIIFLDALNTGIRDQMYARDQVLKFLRNMQSEDHFAIYALTGPTQVQIVHEFTRDDTALIKAMNEFSPKQPDQSIVPFATSLDPSGFPTPIMPTGPQNNSGPSGQENREQLVEQYARLRVYPEVGALIGIANHVALIPGRKNLIWITGGVRMSVRNQDLPEKLKLSDLGYRLATPEYAVTENDLLRAVGESFNAANVVMYGVDVHGTQTDPGFAPTQRSGPGAGTSGVPTPSSALRASQRRLDAEQGLRDTYRKLADETGGTAFYGNNDITEGMAKAFDDGRYAYTLGYYPDHGTWDGSFRKIQVKVSDEKVTVRYRDGYYATPENAPSAAQVERQLQDAANSPLDSNALSMMVSMRHVQAPSATTRELEFQIGVDVAQLLLEHAGGHWKGGIDLVFVQRDEIAQVVAADKKRVDVDFTDAQYQSLLGTGAIFERHVTLVPTANDVRAIVRDANSGLIGTVTVLLKSFFPSGTAAGQPK